MYSSVHSAHCDHVYCHCCAFFQVCFHLCFFFFSFNTLAPVVTIELGEPVTLTCAFTDNFQSTTWIHWYKQNAGDTLKLIVSQQNLINPTYGPEFSTSRFDVRNTNKMSNLTILKTVQQDEGMYHCIQTDMYGSTLNSERTMSYTVVQQPAVFHPHHPDDLVTLQCFVLSDSKNTTCSEEPRVFWFKTGSNKAYPDMIYTDGKKAGNCDKRFDSQEKCIYNFSKSFSSSDAGMYYCAVATCGQIVFGNGTSLRYVITLLLLPNLWFEMLKSGTLKGTFEMKIHFSKQIEDGAGLNYAALHFSEGRASRGKQKRELMTEIVYSQVKGSG
uniref:Ig-like domain-containing protein n=1 Tax=Xiphophorus maculatus TaxID=8083 RepID=A0A3B5QKG4_XIPMA